MIKLNKKLYGVSFVVWAFILRATNVNAQNCTIAPSCEELGFVKSSSDCEGKTSLKCPFDRSKFFCLSEGGNQGFCLSPEIGDVLYADMTCSNSTYIDRNKLVIGVIFNTNQRFALALEEDSLIWSEEYFDVPDLANKTSESEARADFDGKGNTEKVVAYCKANNKSCPAFEYVSNYKTVGTKAGDWYLPAGGELNGIYKNRDALNTVLDKISATKLSVSSYWSSSENSDNNAWGEYFNSESTDRYSKFHSYNVRPILAF